MNRQVEVALCNRPWLASMALCTGFTQSKTEFSLEIVGRVRAAYHRALADNPPELPNDLWRGIAASYHGDLAALLLSDDLEALDGYLRDLPKQSAAQGFFQGRAFYDQCVSDPEALSDHARLSADALAGLAELVGALNVRNPQQGEWTALPFPDTTEMQRAAEAKIGHSLSIPDVFNGCLFVGDRVHSRVCNAASAVFGAARLKPASIAEIGAGLGFTALYTRQRGIQHTLYDLPLMCAVQGYFLLHALGDVRLYGEGDDSPTTRILPWHRYGEEVPTDLTLNVDSFPEINRAVVETYLRKTKGWLYSVNQEAQAWITGETRQLVVREIVGKDPLWRTPNWTRRGYVDEVFWID